MCVSERERTADERETSGEREKREKIMCKKEETEAMRESEMYQTYTHVRARKRERAQTTWTLDTHYLSIIYSCSWVNKPQQTFILTPGCRMYSNTTKLKVVHVDRLPSVHIN